MNERLLILCKALRLLALSSQEQLDHLKILGIEANVNELALEYDDIAAAAEDMLRQQELNILQYDSVTALRRQLTEMTATKDVSLWTVHGLTDRREWKEVRHKAKACLDILKTV